MPAPPKCPGCSTKLQPEWESCPNCPMSFLDAPPEKSTLQSDGVRNIGIPILFFGGLAFFVWTMAQYLWRTAEDGAKSVEFTTKSTSSGKPQPSSQSPVPSSTGGSTGGSTAPETTKAEEEEPATILIVPDKTPKARVATEWKMRGVIYDLLTLKPVPAAHVIFIDNETNVRAQIQTDSQGRYRTILPPLPDRGYLVTLSKPGYQAAYLNPGTEGVADMPLERRQELAKELSTLVAEPAALQPNSDLPLVTDFHMAPK